MLRGIIFNWNQSTLKGRIMQTRKHGWKLTSLAVAMSLIATMTGLLSSHASSASPKAISKTLAHASNAQKINNSNWQLATVRQGDTLARVFSRLSIQRKDLVLLTRHNKQLTRLHAGDKLYFQVDAAHALQGFKYPVSTTKTLVLTRQGNHFAANTSTVPMAATLAFKSATVTRSLPVAARQAGMNGQMISQLQRIFGTSINFKHDIHPGDHVAFIYNEYSVNGKKHHTGEIVAAELTHNGKTYRAIRYQYPHSQHVAYFTPEGRGLESRFLSAPLHYKRISSFFNFHRLDPYLHRVRPHLGVDYAAYSGTPIQSIGEGRVIFVGRESGFGRTVKVRYDAHDVALYAHMWRFAKNLHPHQLVHKGQVIGYVGKSGWATGPHLHFGFYVDGKPKNWLAMKFAGGQLIAAAERRHFLASSRQLLAKLQTYEDTQLALNNEKAYKHSRDENS